MDGEHWANRYIGLPWENGAQGPEAYDCWGLVRAVYRLHYGIDLPVLDVDAMDVRAVMRRIGSETRGDRWTEVQVPGDGDVVALRQARNPSHCGVWIESPSHGISGLLHAVRGAGVVFSSLAHLRIAGWAGLRYYRLANMEGGTQ